MLRILGRLKPFSLAIALGVALIFGQTMADLYLPTLMADVVNKGIATNSIDAILRYGLIMLIMAFASMVASVAAGFLSSRVQQGGGKKTGVNRGKSAARGHQDRRLGFCLGR